MKKQKTKPPISGNQQKRFAEAARELGCDDDEKAFEDRLKRVASSTTDEKPAKKRKKDESDQKS